MAIKADDLLDNPDALDMNDEAAISALIDGAEEVELKDFESDDEGSVATSEADKAGPSVTDDKTDSVASDDNTDKEVPAPIKSKNGDHTIPYNVLENTRTNLKTTNDKLEGANAEIERLQALVKSGGEGATEEEIEEVAKAASTPEEEFVRKNGMSSVDFKKEYGEGLTKSLLAQAEDSLDMRNQLNVLMGDHNEKVDDAAETQSNTLQEAIDAIPALAALQAEGGEKWQEAIDIDNALKMMPKYRDNESDLDGRFAAVAKELGMTVSKPTNKNKIELADDDADALPKSISDLPGGSSVSQSDRESAENMDSADMGRAFESMTQAQQDEYLNNL